MMFELKNKGHNYTLDSFCEEYKISIIYHSKYADLTDIQKVDA